MTDPGYRHVDDLPAVIFRHWIHSREEDSEGLEVYRPEGFGFPPSFGREGIEMRKDGEFIQDDIGPADGVMQVSGRWALVGRSRWWSRSPALRERATRSRS